MKECPLPLDPVEQQRPQGLVLVGLASAVTASPAAASPSLVHRATRQLAELLQRPVLTLNAETDPDAAQTALAAQALASGGGWLASLEVDVGLPLADGRCWAEALGAWRQPALLVIPADQLASGLPAAATALLRHWQVPLVGLLQWGGAWQAEARRRDGLPWLGHLPEQEPAAAAAEPWADNNGGGTDLTTALRLRWRQLERN